MTVPKRRRDLAESLAQQIHSLRAEGDVLPSLIALALEYVDRAIGFSMLRGVDEADIATSDHGTLVQLAGRALLDETARARRDTQASVATFRAALLEAMLTPDTVRLKGLRASIELLADDRPDPAASTP